MRPVPQLDQMGCGVACAAVLLLDRDGGTPRRAYRSAAQAFRDFERLSGEHGAGFRPGLVSGALRWLGFGAAVRKSVSVARIPDHSIILVRRYEGDQWKHYVVKDGDTIIDPMDQLVEQAGDDVWSGLQRRGRHRAWPPDWRALGHIATWLGA